MTIWQIKLDQVVAGVRDNVEHCARGNVAVGQAKVVEVGPATVEERPQDVGGDATVVAAPWQVCLWDKKVNN